MVGLSVVLEADYKDMSSSSSSNKAPQVLSKSNIMIKPSSSSPTSPSSSTPFFKRKSSNLFTFPAADDFLQYCFLCKQKLLPGKDIYMYKGDRAFCSEECRCRQIFMDEEEPIKSKTDQFPLAAIRPQAATRSSASSSRYHRRARN